ncbi:hypothetical protein A1Q1_04674 [Trichosporon asahii var. asahii CBS 2479]|uniref:Uncharacterized protein n=1 Tax=Trichosporon asahii var. asahii (strain ATCC 90039 / CBS 2479 / JCM 2466 / KCTC 7840 / NBRC 103889/ NCYC 2677 / UAMH 7654) TaxID=1186058 RepID=J6EQF4_TRIAS|nr:hypothetical protein A1Q1_04674 [Trichosporon asahii var. asahii CBS 2479]EJT46709.1 hypothetical protein A1Q1_04674 [Trichosporon asahii var. asahii CBS 2479]
MPNTRPRSPKASETGEDDAEYEALRHYVRHELLGHIPHVERFHVDPAVVLKTEPSANGAGKEVRVITTEDGRTEYLTDGWRKVSKGKKDEGNNKAEASKPDNAVINKDTAKSAGETSSQASGGVDAKAD